MFETKQQAVLSVLADFPWSAADSAGISHHSALIHTVLQLQPGSSPITFLVWIPGEEKLQVEVVINVKINCNRSTCLI